MNENMGQSLNCDQVVPVPEFFLGRTQSLAPQAKKCSPFSSYMQQVTGKKKTRGAFMCLFLSFKILITITTPLHLHTFSSSLTTAKEMEIILLTSLFSASLEKVAKSKGSKKESRNKQDPWGMAEDSLSLSVEVFNFINLRTGICVTVALGSRCYDCSFKFDEW